MMKVGVYCVYDRVSALYGEPFTAVNDQVAERRFKFLMEKSQMVSSDCELYKVAEMDIQKGSILPVSDGFICKYNVKSEA